MRTKVTLLSLAAICISFIFTACQQKAEVATTPNRIEQKHEPSDAYFMQRLGPDGRFATVAYTQGLQEARLTASQRSITGFEEDWVTQGPGNIGGRINTVAVHPTNEDIIYVGFSHGGVFKTTDGGDNWLPIFDEQVFLSIGNIVLDPIDPNIVYVATGDANITGLPFIGDGLYRSMDGGDTWTHLGLEAQRIISKVIVDHQNNNTIFAACMGLPFEKNNERGLYRSVDNGSSWEQVLFISDSTGIIDMVMHPDDPNVLYAVGWDRIRNNTISIVKGYGAKVYKTVDGGDNWTILEGGLPNDQPHSRMGIAISESNPNIVYAQYVNADNFQLEAIYRTEDDGNNWTPIPIDEYNNGLSDNAMGGFGWYFGKIRVNPTNPDDIYLLGVDLWRTPFAGQFWEKASPNWWTYEVHADKHDMVFLNDGSLLLATDGGLYRFDNNTQSWEDMEDIPTTQFYRVAHNPFNPDWYYGGAQDNGTTGGNAGNINEWPRIYGGDGFQMAFDPVDADRYFVETQRGNITVTVDGGNNYESGDDGIDSDDRRNWDMPYFISPHFSQVLYTGTYRMYRGVGNIPFWEPISEDLTDGTDTAHRYHNITAVDESPIQEGLLYAGTGDGNLWRGENGGSDWISISAGLPDQYVTDVIASPTDVNTVFVTYSGYRDNDFLPRIHRSANQGADWEDISGNLPDLAINELLIMPETNDSILFVATDGGVYGTVTAGTEWERLGANMPIVPVYDMVLNPVNNELVAGTHARSIMSYPLDSISTPQNPVVSVFNPVQQEEKSLKVYPTIATDYVQVEVENTEPGRAVEVVVLSADGKLVYGPEKLTGMQVAHRLDVSNYMAGQYFVKVKVRHKVMSAGFVVGR